MGRPPHLMLPTCSTLQSTSLCSTWLLRSPPRPLLIPALTHPLTPLVLVGIVAGPQSPLLSAVSIVCRTVWSPLMGPERRQWNTFMVRGSQITLH